MTKKTALIIFLSTITGLTANAQFYFRAGAGYAFPAAGQTMNGEGLRYNGTAVTSDSYDMKSVSFSTGLQTVFGFGYMINKNVGVQLDAGIGLATKQYKYIADSAVVNSVPSILTFEHQSKRPIVLMPSMVLQTGGDPWNIYCRLGLALPLRTQIQQDIIFTNLQGTGAMETNDQQWKLTSSFSLGYSGAAGFCYNMGNRVSIWAEVSVLSLSVYLKQADLTGYLINGQSINLSGVSGTKTLNYNKKGIADSNFVNNPTFSQPFSNVGLNVGVRIQLSDGPSKSAVRRKRDDNEL